ncbi:MAG: type I glyceraldehyde-3-phosphate dehydrogenase [Candidatus Comchoanobacterales bacterium]
MTLKVAINGFGRIGRNIVRAWLQKQHPSISIVAINDLCDIKTLAHLLKYDSVHGRLQEKIDIQGNQLLIDGHVVHVSHERNPASCPWQALNVDVVFEATGIFASKEKSKAHLDAGAKQVLISAPGGSDVDATIVYGVNHQVLTHDMKVISNASCTTNCLAPLLAPIQEAFGVEHGLMTTVHAYTNDQALTDAPHQDLRRARAAALSMIPTKTGAAAAIGLVIPELSGCLDGLAVRVPTANVSIVDVTITLKQDCTMEMIHQCLKNASNNALKGVLAVNEEPLVSIDFNHHPASSIVDFGQTRMMGPRMVKLMAWYDNEWGFSNRMLDTATAMLVSSRSMVNS